MRMSSSKDKTAAMEVDTTPIVSTSSASASAAPGPSRAESLLSTFSQFRIEIDAHYDRRERIVKLSRDVTALSKKLIFALHRITTKPRKAVEKEAEEKLAELRSLFQKLQCEVEGENFWRYEKSVSPGIQEYLEALTFHYYITHYSLPSLSACQSSLLPPPAPPAPEPELSSLETEVETLPLATSSSLQIDSEPTPYVQITIEDYLGGIADLTGELMRLAIASVGSSLSAGATKAGGGGEGRDGKVKEGAGASIDEIGRFVRDIKGEMDPLAPYARWLNKKLTVLDQSLAKIESASYALKVRGAEYANSPAMLEMFAQRLASGDAGVLGGGGPPGDERGDTA